MPSASDQFPQRIALVHEWFSPRSVGGAERVVEVVDGLLQRLGCEPQLAALIDAESSRSGSWLQGRSVLTSPIQSLPWGRSHVQQYLPLLPYAIEQIDLSAAELVISSSHLVARSPDKSGSAPHQLCPHPGALRLGSDARLPPALGAGAARPAFDSLAVACPSPVGSTQRTARRSCRSITPPDT